MGRSKEVVTDRRDTQGRRPGAERLQHKGHPEPEKAENEQGQEKPSALPVCLRAGRSRAERHPRCWEGEMSPDSRVPWPAR